MSASGYEIRLQLLREAKDLLLQDWHHECEVESQRAASEKRPMQRVPSPEPDEVLDLAAHLYEFVLRKD